MAANLHKNFELYNSHDKKVKTTPLFSVVEVTSVTIFLVSLWCLYYLFLYVSLKNHDYEESMWS